MPDADLEEPGPLSEHEGEGEGYVSLTSTKRRRFLWVAWWTQAPRRSPFLAPDAFEGGARSEEEALEAARARAGVRLKVLDGMWARAWVRVQRGLPAWVEREAREARRARRSGSGFEVPRGTSAWAVLGLEPGASEGEVKRAFREAVLQSHPDRGGDVRRFLLVKWAYEVLTGGL